MTGDVLYVIDFDRTLVDVDRVMSLVEKASAGLDIDFTSIKKEQARASEEGWSYSPLERIAQAGEENLGMFKERFLALAEPEELIFPDAKECLLRLDEKKAPYLIMTYASDKTWQQLKLQASNLSKIPHIITFSKLKGREISGWRSEDGKYKTPVEGIAPADAIILIDDRQRVFVDFPSDCRGYFINRLQEPFDKANLPPNVTEITSFDDIIDRI